MPSTYTYTTAQSVSASVDRYLWPALDRELMEVPRGSSVLDLGCGNGAATAHFAQSGLRMSGVDSSESGIALASKAYPECDFHCCDGQSELPFSKSSFAAIVCIEVIEHVFAPEMLIANCSHLLAPGGKLILTTPYHGWLKNVVIACSNKYDSHHTALWTGGHIKFWSVQTIRQLLENNGMSVIRIYGVGRLPWLWKSMVVVATHKNPK